MNVTVREAFHRVKKESTRARQFMLIAGEPSGDLLAADLVRALQSAIEDPFPPRFFGAGGSGMADAGVELVEDMTSHSTIGLWEAIEHLGHFYRIFRHLVRTAVQRQPDYIVCVDYAGFNRRFARAIRGRCRSQDGPFQNWNPKIIQFVSPQVWASRPGRAWKMARDFDLLLSIFPFEKEWYTRRVPGFPVEFVGHPLMDRYPRLDHWEQPGSAEQQPPLVLLLPGSRAGELARHIPVIVTAARRIKTQVDARFQLIVPSTALAAMANSLCQESKRRDLAASSFDLQSHPHIEIQAGGLQEGLRSATIAIASSGTVTMECARFGVPTVVLYRTSWLTYVVARQIATVRFLAMPNLLADRELFPEFIQNDATADNLSRAALGFLNNPERMRYVKTDLAGVIQALGKPGASERAASAILGL